MATMDIEFASLMVIWLQWLQLTWTIQSLLA